MTTAGRHCRRLSSSSPEETHHIGVTLGAHIQAGEVVALVGELGSGKTALIQGMCDGWGVQGPVTSPTFTYVNEYHGHSNICHADLYRVETREAFDALGLDYYLEQRYICCIEWADRIPALLGSSDVLIRMKLMHDAPTTRIIDIESVYDIGN